MQTVLGARLAAEEIESEVQRHFYVTALGKVVSDMLPDLTLAGLNQILAIEGETYLKAALAEGRGVLLLGTHFGLHGYVPLTLIKRLGYSFVTVIGQEYSSRDSWIYLHFVHPIRSRNWREMPVINPNGNPQREMVTSLQQKQLLMIWPDFINEELFRLPPPHALRVPFLDRSMPFRTGAFRLAQWLNVPMLPFFIVPRPQGFAMVIEGPLPVTPDNSMAGLMANLTAFTARLETHILLYPGLWWQWRQKWLLEMMQSPGSNEQFTPLTKDRGIF
jgi:lauroyl/myristoyl acyltransferase